ncbi:MAG: serine/threonine-protein kinase, partial [Myxococcota bacterium]
FKMLLPHRVKRSKKAEVEVARFLREMRVIADIEHPHVVRLIDSGKIEVRARPAAAAPAKGGVASNRKEAATMVEEPSADRSGPVPSSDGSSGDVVGLVPYIVMEYLDGETLAATIDRESPLEVEMTVELLLPVVSALGAAHERGVVHRDVKPQNVLVVHDHLGTPCPKVLDFGIAKVTEPGHDELTRSDSFIGTPEYMAPEQGRGKRNIDGRADQFSVAAIAYQCLTGRKLYEAESFLAMIHAVATGDFSPPSEVGIKLPEGFEDVLLRALARNPDDRYETIEAFGRDLLPFAEAKVQRRWADVLIDREEEIEKLVMSPERVPLGYEDQAPTFEVGPEDEGEAAITGAAGATVDFAPASDTDEKATAIEETHPDMRTFRPEETAETAPPSEEEPLPATKSSTTGLSHATTLPPEVGPAVIAVELARDADPTSSANTAPDDEPPREPSSAGASTSSSNSTPAVVLFLLTLVLIVYLASR